MVGLGWGWGYMWEEAAECSPKSHINGLMEIPTFLCFSKAILPHHDICNWPFEVWASLEEPRTFVFFLFIISGRLATLFFPQLLFPCLTFVCLCFLSVNCWWKCQHFGYLPTESLLFWFKRGTSLQGRGDLGSSHSTIEIQVYFLHYSSLYMYCMYVCWFLFPNFSYDTHGIRTCVQVVLLVSFFLYLIFLFPSQNWKRANH